METSTSPPLGLYNRMGEGEAGGLASNCRIQFQNTIFLFGSGTRSVVGKLMLKYLTAKLAKKREGRKEKWFRSIFFACSANPFGLFAVISFTM